MTSVDTTQGFFPKDDLTLPGTIFRVNDQVAKDCGLKSPLTVIILLHRDDLLVFGQLRAQSYLKSDVRWGESIIPVDHSPFTVPALASLLFTFSLPANALKQESLTPIARIPDLDQRLAQMPTQIVATTERGSHLWQTLGDALSALATP